MTGSRPVASSMKIRQSYPPLKEPMTEGIDLQAPKETARDEAGDPILARAYIGHSSHRRKIERSPRWFSTEMNWSTDDRYFTST